MSKYAMMSEKGDNDILMERMSEKVGDEFKISTREQQYMYINPDDR
jgi:hypothetical protein